ncbi:MAG TPA: GH3 auxin-responsive promoter family protein [Bacteroidales bacterium]|nr:GH3 auxin-responsive promoter family protein [Bacteroidales bacterium]
MPLITSIVNWLNVKRAHQIELFRKYPFDIQQETLFRLMSKAAETEWGMKYEYISIETIEDYQKRVPLQTYEDLKQYVTRLRNGQKNVLWPGEIKWFARSSGTTNDKSKFIPVSKECLEECHFRGGRDVLVIYMQNNPDSKIFSGKGLTLGGSHHIDNYSAQTYTGDLSAILIENLPFWTEFIRTPSQEVALMDNWEQKLDKIIQETLGENVTSIAGVPSWNLVMIKHILNHTGKKSLPEIWPNLELFIHGGVNFNPYKEQFEKLIPSSNMHYQEAYNASEGFFAIQDDPSDASMLLMLDYGVFYEFIPVEQFSEKNPVVHTVGNVQKNRNYVMVISTNTGLWRYVIGDTIKFTSLYPHKVLISGRTKHFINAFGEELIIDNAEKALKIACEKTQSLINDYTAAPIFMSSDKKGAHEWLIEFENEPQNIDYFTTLLDNALMSLNSDYEAKRYKNITLDVPVIKSMARGVFYKWLESKGKLGGQNKVPRLSNDRHYVDELLKLDQKIRNADC